MSAEWKVDILVLSESNENSDIETTSQLVDK